MAYARKDVAVRELEAEFFDGFDYINSAFLRSGGGNPKQVYKLSPSAFEFLVARRCRPVFEIYHRVFHAAAALAKPMSAAEMFFAQAQFNLKIEQEQARQAAQLQQLQLQQQTETEQREQFQTNVQEDIAQLKLLAPKKGYLTILAYCNKNGFHLTTKEAAQFGRELGKHCRENDIPILKVTDARWGEVNSYPIAVLDLLF